MKKASGRTKLQRIVTLLVSALLFVSVLPARAFADADDEQETVRVGFFAMDGYHMEDADGARSGYGYGFLQLIARYSNLRFEYVGYDKSWAEMQEMLQNGEIDLLTSAQKTEAREALYEFSATLIGTSAAILTVKAGDERYQDGNYDGMRIGLVENSSRNEQLDAFMSARGFSYTPVYYSEMNDVTAALQEGKDIDAAMTSNLRRTENEWTLEELDSSPYYAIVKKGNTALIEKINAAIERMDVDAAGWRTKLFNEYYSIDSGEVVSFSASERAYLQALAESGRVLRVTMNPDCAPYSYFENGKAMGIIPDIFAEVAARMGISYEIIEPADRADYQRMFTEETIDIILDGMNDFYTVESHDLEISDVYYTAPLAIFTKKTNASEVESLVQPAVSILNETAYSYMFSGKTVLDAECGSLSEIADYIKSGKADGSYLPYYSVQWLCSADVTGQTNCLILPEYERDFVYAVSADEDYLLLSSLDKALGSLSEDVIASIVTADTEYPEKGASFLGFVYQHPIPAAAIAIVFLGMVVAALFFADKSRRAQNELRRTRMMERYISYLCDMYYKVLEVDLDLRSRKQYRKRDGEIQIEERNDFSGFDIASIHPDDLDACLAVFDLAIVRSLFDKDEDERYIECRMKADDGDYRWFGFILKLIARDAEHPCSVMLLIKDINDLHLERERSRDALVNALDAANSASRSKSVFLSSMSHEIRTPLNAVIGYMTVASMSVDDHDKVLHCVESAGVAAKHLLSIINDVLDISAMESGKMKLAKERFDLKEQISGISTIFYQQCRQKNIKFVISVNGLTEEWVVGDSMRVNQILMNLMSNAVKFTSEGSVNLTIVQTALNASSVFIRFIVKDTGIGMSEEYQQRLFTPFEQESAETARRFGGTGLGMSITFNLVSLKGGKIEVSSKHGEGSTFTVTLPFGRVENNQPRTISNDMSKLHVLIVDDLENECDYVHALLTRCGISSESVQSGEDAVRLVAARKNTPERFSMCIIDWNMPGLSGVETTRLIHEECDPDIPIIIATAFDISEFESEALAAGAARIIAKPLFQSTLFDLLVSTYGKYDAAPEKDDEIPDLSCMHLLLAEDNEMNVEVAVEILELAGITVDVARNGKEAVDAFLTSQRDYDAILMDVQMPEMDGYAATKAIRTSGHPRAKTVPIIAMTANAFAEDVSASLAAGMNGHLSKPIETDALFSTLKKISQK